jgi:type VI protein secretion system component Hcp
MHTKVRRIALAAALTTAGLALATGSAQASKTTITLAIGAQSSPLTSYSWGATNSVTAQGGGAGAGKVDVQDLKVTKDTDALTPSLVRSVATGEHLQQVAVQFTNGVFTSSYCLRDVVVSSVTNAANAGDDRPTDAVAFNFARFTFKVGATAFGFDLVDNVPDANPC